MSAFIRHIVSRPVGAIVIALAIAVMGSLASQRLQMTLLPPVESPIITVRADRAGSSALELEEQVLTPLQDLLATLPGLAAMQGRAAQDRVEVQLALQASADMDDSMDRLRERLEGWRRPRGLDKPRVLRYDPGTEPLMRFLLRPVAGGPDLAALAVAAREDLLPRFEGRSAIASALLRGGDEMEMRVTVDELALQAAGLEADDVRQAINNGVESRSIGSIRTAEGTQRIMLRGPATLPEHLPNLPVANGLRVADLATLSWEAGESDELTIALLDDGISESLLVEVYMQAQGTVVEAADDLLSLLDEMAPSEDGQHWDFAGGQLTLLSDRSEPIRVAIEEVISSMTVGALLAGLVLLFFLRSFGAALVVFLSVPLSVAGAFLVLAQCNIGVNLMSLGGLALGIGMLVDNAIVVIEAARRGNKATHQEQLNQVSRGTSEVASSVIAATATTLAVFLPLLFAPGFLGELLGDLAIAVAASLGASLFVALLITPPLLGMGGYNKPATSLFITSNIHAGYKLPLPNALRTVSWWLLTFIPAICLLIMGLVAIALGASSGLTTMELLLIGLSAPIISWLAIAIQWLARHIPEDESLIRWLFSLPLRLGNLAVVQFRWWLVLMVCLPLTAIRILIWCLRLLRRFKPVRILCDAAMAGYDYAGSTLVTGYERLLQAILRVPLLSLFIFLAIAAGSIITAPQMTLRLMPETTNQRFVMDLQLSRGTDVESTRQWSGAFLAELQKRDPALRGVAISGEDARFSPTLDRREPHQIQLVLLKNTAAVDPKAEAKWLATIEQLALNSGALSAAMWPPPLFSLGHSDNSVLSLAVSGGDTVALNDTVLRWQSSLRLLGARGIRSSANDANEEIAIIANARQLQEVDISWQQFQDRIAAATEVIDIDTFRPRYDGITPSGTILPIRIQGERREAPLSSLSSLNIGTAERPVPLGTVAKFERIPASGIIYHRDGQRVATLSATALPAGHDANETIAQLMAQHPLPNGMEVLNFGLETVTTGHLQALLGLLGLAVFLVLVVMAVQFEDLVQPLIILIAVPMAVAGALPGLYLFGYGLDTMSGIGLVVLSGIAVNNAIVLVTTVNLYRDQGQKVAVAIREASKSRLRPIAMTTLTTILALLPLAIGWGDASQLRAPLAIAVIAGMCSSTISILIALPGILSLVMRDKKTPA